MVAERWVQGIGAVVTLAGLLAASPGGTMWALRSSWSRVPLRVRRLFVRGPNRGRANGTLSLVRSNMAGRATRIPRYREHGTVDERLDDVMEAIRQLRKDDSELAAGAEAIRNEAVKERRELERRLEEKLEALRQEQSQRDAQSEAIDGRTLLPAAIGFLLTTFPGWFATWPLHLGLVLSILVLLGTARLGPVTKVTGGVSACPVG